ncbi:hypothetical protein Droror1_Dr00018350 [Drosera rotundifolia]
MGPWINQGMKASDLATSSILLSSLQQDLIRSCTFVEPWEIEDLFPKLKLGGVLVLRAFEIVERNNSGGSSGEAQRNTEAVQGVVTHSSGNHAAAFMDGDDLKVDLDTLKQAGATGVYEKNGRKVLLWAANEDFLML